ncbi:hypothetical protein CWB99_15030 [Pseudoalteromonas rubra]|uniref:Uncharacterized protein n=1 Tax=Pseudoalteromonas rubra TaxID=43658 RepID=A0A5S3WJ45_9GAMM|nr:hypothetical protein [Pseudoalteromonas rubra]TMP27311.1 hypothetical protein CWB99_15030 [Pseudoalteromonas rubra]TMP36849.1 hypothetical protein CWC00_00915 [Pseudoalteromonas rubra]
MAQRPKKQTLLNQVDARSKKKRPTQKKRLSPQQQRALQQQQQAQLAAAQQAEVKPNKNRWIAAAILLLLIIIFPKPKLITYEKLGLVAQSVYWPGLPGVQPILFDSNLHIRPALERNTLYLCQDERDPDSCQKYQIIEQQGFISALIKLILD